MPGGYGGATVVLAFRWWLNTAPAARCGSAGRCDGSRLSGAPEVLATAVAEVLGGVLLVVLLK